jgi:hypothetical protein
MTPPVDPSELTFLPVNTRSPYTRDYPGSGGGKQAHYMLRCVIAFRTSNVTVDADP